MHAEEDYDVDMKMQSRAELNRSQALAMVSDEEGGMIFLAYPNEPNGNRCTALLFLSQALPRSAKSEEFTVFSSVDESFS